jgi:hypothetical protein
MNIDGSLILDIALGIVVAKVLTNMLKEMERFLERRTSRRKDIPASDEHGIDAEDWLELWSGLPESTKERVKAIVEDDALRRRAQDLNLWPYLWSAAPEEMKDKLRSRWKVAQIPPKAR